MFNIEELYCNNVYTREPNVGAQSVRFYLACFHSTTKCWIILIFFDVACFSSHYVTRCNINIRVICILSIWIVITTFKVTVLSLLSLALAGMWY